MTSRLTTVRAAALATAAVFMIPGAASAATCGASAESQPLASRGSGERSALVCLINETRKQHHLRPLVNRPTLSSAASTWSERLVSGGFFAHVDAAANSTIETRDLRYTAGAYLWALGENLAWATGYRSSPRQIVTMWLASPGHRANLLDPQWRDIGVGIASGTPVGAAGATYAVEFGTKWVRRLRK